jgi:hypothetical protein
MGPEVELREPMGALERRLDGSMEGHEPRLLQCAIPQETQAIPQRPHRAIECWRAEFGHRPSTGPEYLPESCRCASSEGWRVLRETVPPG